MHRHTTDHTLSFIHWLLIIKYLQFWHRLRSGIYEQPPEFFLKILQISQENTWVGVSYLQSCKPSGLQLYSKKTPTQVFSCEIWEILGEEHLFWRTCERLLLCIDYFIIYWFSQSSTVHVFHFYKELFLYYAIKTIELMTLRRFPLKKYFTEGNF